MNEELISYYVDLLIIQYRDKAKAVGHIEALTELLMIYDLIRAVENAYDPDTAVGVQLDILAKYVGADRIVTDFAFVRTFFGFADYVASSPITSAFGMLEYAATGFPDGQLLTYESGETSSFSLTDQELRDIIKLKIVQNSSNYSPGSIDKLIFDFFGSDAIFNDGLNMTVEYIFSTSIQRLVQIAQAQNALPKPMAVGLLISFVPDINNIFGMIDYSATSIPDFLQGMNIYSELPAGSWLAY